MPAALESVITTAQLSARASRVPDYETECSILESLSLGMVRSPELLLRRLALAALVLCRAGSAGVSLVEPGGTRFRWRALSGQLASHLGDTMPRAFSPCGTVAERNSIQLFSYPQRHFEYFAALRPTIVEVLLVPFLFAAQPVGTIWVMHHDEQHHFDSEDARLMRNLSRFAVAAGR